MASRQPASVAADTLVSSRYLQQLIDHECESAKQNGTFDNGVLFLSGDVKEVQREVVWRSPKAGGGEVCHSQFTARILQSRETSMLLIMLA
jgi:hypothetical protein